MTYYSSIQIRKKKKKFTESFLRSLPHAGNQAAFVNLKKKQSTKRKNSHKKAKTEYQYLINNVITVHKIYI
jgi:hypothetical protein